MALGLPQPSLLHQVDEFVTLIVVHCATTVAEGIITENNTTATRRLKPTTAM
jgi:hypothetical protein